MLRRVDSRAKGELCWLWASVLAFTQGGLDVQQGQPGSAHTSILHECWCAVRPPTREGTHCAPPLCVSLQIPETLAACGFSKASRLSLLETAPLRCSGELAN